MRILKLDEKNKFISVLPETLDDLWHLEKIIEPNDIVKAITSRKIKAEEGRKAIRENIFVELQVEKTELQEFSSLLRISGIILGGKPSELIELKAHQNIEISLGQKLDLIKNEWKQFQVERLKKAEADSKKKPFLLLVLDDESALIAFLKEFKLEQKVEIKSRKSGKQFQDNSWKNKYFNEIYLKLSELSPEKIIIAGPGFIKEEFNDFLKEKNFKGKVFLESISSTGITGINELLKGKGIQRIIKDLELIKDTELIELLFKELAQNSALAEYGLKEIENAVNFRAIKQLLLTDSFLLKNREKAESLMLAVEQMNGLIHIIPIESDAGKKLESLGGIAALLRFRIK